MAIASKTELMIIYEDETNKSCRKSNGNLKNDYIEWKKERTKEYWDKFNRKRLAKFKKILKENKKKYCSESKIKALELRITNIQRRINN